MRRRGAGERAITSPLGSAEDQHRPLEVANIGLAVVPEEESRISASFADEWLRRLVPPVDAEVTLICCPHAGGAATAYASLARALAPRVEVRAVQYPGRQDRRHERPFGGIAEVSEVLAGLLRRRGDRRYALFGHSMGALIAYETALRLERAAGADPEWLFVSGRSAPTLGPGPGDRVEGDAALLAEIRRLGGSDAVLADPELVEMILPALRADYRALRAYEWAPGDRLRCPITALIGDTDPLVTPETAAHWLDLSLRPGDVRVFAGGHFYLDRQAEKLAGVIANALGDDTDPTGSAPAGSGMS